MKLFKLIGALFLPFLMIGCATHSVNHAPDLAYDLHAQQEQLEAKGVFLMARPIHEKSDLESYFADDLIKLGILPVQVNITNKSTDRNLFFRSDSITLYDQNGDRQSQLTFNQLIDRTKKSYWRSAGWGVALGFIGAGVSAANVAHANKKIRSTYETSMIKTGNLNQGNVTEGFVFFDVPKDLNTLDGWKLDLLLADPVQGNSVAFEYGLSGTVLARKADKTDSSSSEEDL